MKKMKRDKKGERIKKGKEEEKRKNKNKEEKNLDFGPTTLFFQTPDRDHLATKTKLLTVTSKLMFYANNEISYVNCHFWFSKRSFKANSCILLAYLL